MLEPQLGEFEYSLEEARLYKDEMALRLVSGKDRRLRRRSVDPHLADIPVCGVEPIEKTYLQIKRGGRL